MPEQMFGGFVPNCASKTSCILNPGRKSNLVLAFRDSCLLIDICIQCVWTQIAGNSSRLFMKSKPGEFRSAGAFAGCCGSAPWLARGVDACSFDRHSCGTDRVCHCEEQ